MIAQLNTDATFNPVSVLSPSGEGESSENVYPDVNGDNYVSPLDALLVITKLNELEEEAEGEAAGNMTDSNVAVALLNGTPEESRNSIRLESSPTVTASGHSRCCTRHHGGNFRGLGF